MVNLWSGFYALDWEAWWRLEGPWKQAGLSSETMSAVAFLRALIRSQPIPSRVRIPGLDRALYALYRQYEAEDGEREASRQIERVVRSLGQTLYRYREHLLRERPAVLFVLEYVEHGVYWRAGIRHRGTGQPQELFRLEWLFPHCEVTQVDSEMVCFSPF
jgi:hypothetical protein